LKNWLLDRLEDRRYWPGVEVQTTARLADGASGDAEFMQVATLDRGRSDFDVSALVAELVEGVVRSIPASSASTKRPGLRQAATLGAARGDLQRQEDAGKERRRTFLSRPETMTAPIFKQTDYWRLRRQARRFPQGTLDQLSAPGSTENDTSLVVAWAGWGSFATGDGADRLSRLPQALGLDPAAADAAIGGPGSTAAVDSPVASRNRHGVRRDGGQVFPDHAQHDAHELGLTLEEVLKLATAGEVKRAEEGTEDDE
jgi:hypothetical protein